MTTYQHAPACLAATAERDAWRAEWPNACPSCRGEGSVEFRNWTDLGWEYGRESCPACTDNLRCGRCGHDAMLDVEPLVSPLALALMPHWWWPLVVGKSYPVDASSGYVACPWCGWTDDPELQDDGMMEPGWECWNDCNRCASCGHNQHGASPCAEVVDVVVGHRLAHGGVPVEDEADVVCGCVDGTDVPA